VAYVLVFGLFVIMALQNLGVELLPLIAGLGIAGAGIALAMQGVLGNAVAGLTIIFSRPFRVGDYISIANEEGEVLEIQLFSTTLGHVDRSRVVIPNRKIAGEILHNYGRIRQLAIDVMVTNDTDIATALAVAVEATRGNARKPPEANSLHPARDQNVHRRHQNLPSHSEKYRERRGHRSFGLHAVEIVDDQLSGSYPPRDPVESFGNLLRAWCATRRSVRSSERFGFLTRPLTVSP